MKSKKSLAARTLPKTLKCVLPGKTARERRIAARLTNAYRIVAKSAIRSFVPEILEPVYETAETLSAVLVFGTLETITVRIEGYLEQRQGSKCENAAPAGWSDMFLGSRVCEFLSTTRGITTVDEYANVGVFFEVWDILGKYPLDRGVLCGLEQAFNNARKQARHLQFSALESAAMLMEDVVALPWK
jgi:hypothetical protein